jgi:hypothetical protein
VIGIGIGIGHGGAKSFSPPDILGLVGWYRADLGITLAVGTAIATWADQSGSGHDLLGVAPTQPTFNASDANFGGKPSVSFDQPSSQGMQTAPLALAQPLTWYFVARRTTAPFTQQLSDGSVVREATYVTGTTVQMYAGAAFGTKQWAAGDVHALVTVYNGAASAIYLDDSTAPQLGDAGTNGLDLISVSVPSAQAWDGQMAEVLIYQGAHTAVEVAKVFAYIAARYGLAVS